MIDFIRPRWLVVGAIVAFMLGVIGLFVGWVTFAPMALLASEVLTIVAAILLTTPPIPASLAARQEGAVESPDTAAADKPDQS